MKNQDEIKGHALSGDYLKAIDVFKKIEHEFELSNYNKKSSWILGLSKYHFAKQQVSKAFKMQLF